jgi:hypothetical protein
MLGRGFGGCWIDGHSADGISFSHQSSAISHQVNQFRYRSAAEELI